MSDPRPLDWDSLAARLALPRSSSTHKTDAGRRVDRLIPRLPASACDIEITLALLTAASSGTLRQRLTEIHALHTRSRQALEPRAQSPATSTGRFALAARRARAASAESARMLDDLAARSRGAVAAALADTPDAELDRHAVVDGLRQLFERGRLAGDRVESILGDLAGILAPATPDAERGR